MTLGTASIWLVAGLLVCFVSAELIYVNYGKKLMARFLNEDPAPLYLQVNHHTWVDLEAAPYRPSRHSLAEESTIRIEDVAKPEQAYYWDSRLQRADGRPARRLPLWVGPF